MESEPNKNPNQLVLFSDTAHKDVFLLHVGQAALFNGKLGWHNNAVEYEESAQIIPFLKREDPEDIVA